MLSLRNSLFFFIKVISFFSLSHHGFVVFHSFACTLTKNKKKILARKNHNFLINIINKMSKMIRLKEEFEFKIRSQQSFFSQHRIPTNQAIEMTFIQVSTLLVSEMMKCSSIGRKLLDSFRCIFTVYFYFHLSKTSNFVCYCEPFYEVGPRS
jgi:hypothetical protein